MGATLVMGALGVPLLGEGVLSTWEMPVDEIVSSGPDRIIVYEGAEEKLKQLNSGFLVIIAVAVKTNTGMVKIGSTTDILFQVTRSLEKGQKSSVP